jgi:hypothetical protein
MKSKAIGLAGVLALVGASVAFAAPPAGKGKPAATGAGCKPNVSVILKGTLTGDGGTAPFSLPLNVTGGNKFAHAYKLATQPISVQVVSSTKVSRQGHTSSTDLKSGDVVNVRAQACKADLANGATPSLSAVRVVAHPAHA